MAVKKVIYGGNFYFQLLPGVANGPAVRLNNNHRKCELLAVTWCHQVYNVTLGQRQPDETNISNLWQLQIIRDAITTNPLVKIFDTVNPPAPTYYDILLYKPGRYEYENIIFYDGVSFSFTYNNLHPIQTFDFCLNLSVQLNEW